jgi:hypothetical protein
LHLAGSAFDSLFQCDLPLLCYAHHDFGAVGSSLLSLFRAFGGVTSFSSFTCQCCFTCYFGRSVICRHGASETCVGAIEGSVSHCFYRPDISFPTVSDSASVTSLIEWCSTRLRKFNCAADTRNSGTLFYPTLHIQGLAFHT